MKLRILSSLVVTIILALFCIVSSLIAHFGETDPLIDRSVATFFLVIFGLFFIGYTVWNLNLLRKFGDEEKILSESDQRIKTLQDSLNANQNLFQSQIELLNKIVEERSRYDTWQLKNSPIGVLAFFADGHIDKEYSEVCHNFFGDQFAQSPIYEVLYAELKDRNYFKEWLEVVSLSKLPFNDLVGLLNPESTLLEKNVKNNRKPKQMELRYQFCPVGKPEAPLKIDKVIVFVMDVTKEKRLANELSIKESKLEFILNILRDRGRYRKYLEVCSQCIAEVQSIANQLLVGNPQENVAAAFRLVHTIRGNSAAFGVRSLRDLGDTIEKLLIAGRDGDLKIDETFQTQLKNLIPDLQKGLVLHIEETERVFNEVFDPHKFADVTYGVSQSFLKEFELTIDKVADPEVKSLIFRKIKEISLVKIKKFLLQYSEIIQQLSTRQEKKISPLFINGGEVLVDEKKLESFFAAFVHLVLNCVDHGIEKPEERLEKGKAEEAIIRIRAQTGDNGLYISIEDDGRGIDPDALVEKALQKNMITKNHIAVMSLEDKYNLIFKEGFSTSRRITSTSGRGVGMSAIKHEVDKLGGTIKISSKIGKGTMFIIFLPVEAY